MAKQKQSLMKAAGEEKTFVKVLRFSGYGFIGILVALFLLGLIKG